MSVAVEERQLVAPVTAVCFTEDRNWVLSGCGPYLRVHPIRTETTGRPASQAFYQTKVLCICMTVPPPCPAARAPIIPPRPAAI